MVLSMATGKFGGYYLFSWAWSVKFNGARYDFTKGVSNLAGRPHALTIWNTHNSTFTGIRFVQSQMWYAWPTITQMQNLIFSGQ
jgi:hypothetical protein